MNCNVQFIYHLAAIVGVSKVISNSYNVLVDNIKILENILNFASLQKKLTTPRFFEESRGKPYQMVYRECIQANKLENYHHLTLVRV